MDEGRPIYPMTKKRVTSGLYNGYYRFTQKLQKKLQPLNIMAIERFFVLIGVTHLLICFETAQTSFSFLVISLVGSSKVLNILQLKFDV